MDERLTNIEAQKQAQLNKNDQLYSGLLTDAQNLYNQQQNYANQYQQTQNEILDKQLAYNTGLIEQQKEIAKENARTEQNKAKNDYFSYINPYGLQAESLASRGLLNSGVSETAKLGGFNTYQNRLASANKVMQDAITQYDNDINAARLNNDVSKAQNALEKLKMQLQYSESYYNKKGELQQTQFNTGRNIDADYYNRYQTEYTNIQNEKAAQEAIRQWEAQMAYQKERDRIADEQWAKEYALSQQKASASRSSSSGSSGYSLGGGTSKSSGYSIVSEDENGWKKTNLTQNLSGGGKAEVFENPQGELLYWNPSTNGWSKYGNGFASSYNGNSAITDDDGNVTIYSSKNNGSNRTLKSTYTPTLSTAEKTKWLSQNTWPNMTETDLARVIAQGNFSKSDIEKIYKSFGL